MIESVATRGYAETSVAGLCRLAGISKRTFYEQFDNKLECFLTSYDRVAACTIARVASASDSADNPEARLGAMLQAVALMIAEQPKAGRLVLVAVGEGGRPALVRRDHIRLELERLIVASFGETGLLPFIARGIRDGIEQAARRCLLEDEPKRLRTLVEELLTWALSYHSPEIAELPLALTRLPAREPRLARVRARPDDEHMRMLRAAAELVAEEGSARLTIGQIAHRAGVSSQELARYGSVEDCLLEALDVLGLEAVMSAALACRSAEDGLTGVYWGLSALMEHLAGDPALCAVAFGEAQALGGAAMESSERLFEVIVEVFARELPIARDPSPQALQASSAALWGLISHHLMRGKPHLLPRLVGHGTLLLLAPVVGVETAAELIAAAEPDGGTAHAIRGSAGSGGTTASGVGRLSANRV